MIYIIDKNYMIFKNEFKEYLRFLWRRNLNFFKGFFKRFK